MTVGSPGHLAANLTLLVVLLFAPGLSRACETLPDLRIHVTAKFDPAVVRNDFSLADIAGLARQEPHDSRQRDTGHALVGFYTSQFAYTVEVGPEADFVCPTHIDTLVTMRLQHRLIEISREAATNACTHATALRHYRRLAEVDEQTVQRFGARAAGMLAQASLGLKMINAARTDDLDVVLRGKIRAVVDGAIASLSAARRDAQRAVNNPDELKQLATACSI